MARCSEKTGAGYRCRAEAMKGKTYCWFHKPPTRREAHTIGMMSGTKYGAAYRRSQYIDPPAGRTYRKQRRQKRKSRRSSRR